MAIDPVAGSAVPAMAAIVEAELNALAAEGVALRALLSEGDVVQARVLPSNGLTDLLEIAGHRVAASLPPTLRPGDIVAVRVTAVDGERIQLQILPEGQASPEVAPPAAEPPPLPGPPPGLTASRPAAAPAAATGAFVPTVEVSLPPPGTPLAPSPAVFVAASVRPAPAPSAPAPTPAPSAPAPTPAPSAPASPAPPRPATGTAPPQSPPIEAPPSQATVRAPLPPTTLLASIEARLATARATTVSSPPPAPAASAPPAPVTAASSGAPPAVRQPVTPALLTRPAISMRPPAAAPQAQAAAVAGTAPRGLALYREPVALLRALRLPVTPTNVAAAKTALEEPQRLPNALAALERALPSSGDPRIATLRTLAAFVGRIDPKSPVLGAQIAAYIEHVVGGGEPKLAALLVAQRAVAQAAAPTASAAAPPAAAPAGAPDAPASAVSPSSLPSAQPLAAGAAPPVPTEHIARAAERAIALQHDLKSQLFSLAATPPVNAPEALASAIGSALTAITALQVNAATTLAANPGGIAFAIPVALPNGTPAQANVRIDRDAPQPRGAAVDGDNFHIAFVLETQHLGVVAIDLVTVGRTVTVGVKTEAALAASHFRGALEGLTARLEKLRYKVAKADAAVAARGTASVVPAGTPATPSGPADPDVMIDRSV